MSRTPLARLLATVVVIATAVAGSAGPAAARRGAGAPAAGGATVADGQGGPSSPGFRPGQLIVKVRRGHGVGLQQALLRVGGRAASALGGGLSLAQVPAGTEHAAAARLAADPSVEYAEPNFFLPAASATEAEITWGVRHSGAPRLWQRVPAITGHGVRVAVLDSGVDGSRTELENRVVRGFDAFGGSGRDDCGHGTAVAGVVAAADDGTGIAGVAPDATIVPVKVLAVDDFFGVCGGDNASIIRGILWAADPRGGAADVINMSFGGPQRSDALHDAVRTAAAQGVLMVAASGNTADRAVHYPAAYPEVISVGGLERADTSVRWWPQSTFGSVDIAAPARGIPVLIAKGVDAERVGRRCSGGTGWCSDGTSFAAPHVAGVAALLHEQHDELDSAGASARVRLVRQWLLATAPRVDNTAAGVDLKTGHGYPDAVGAADASIDPTRVLLSWRAGQRVLSPTSRMTATPASLPMTLVVTTGTGTPVVDQRVTFTPAAGGSVPVSSVVTDSSGGAATSFRSTAAGSRTRLSAEVGTQQLAIDNYVLQHDDNVPGVRPPALVFRNRLNVADDIDDVFRFSLSAGQILRVEATEVDQRREYVELYLHRNTTRDVTDPYRAPLREDSGFGDDPLRLSRTATEDGVQYLDVYGYGSYRLRWWIVVPGRIRSLSARPVTFSPDGDGYRDRTRLRWNNARRGRIIVRIRNGTGVVRRINLGEQSRGWHAHRWNGRNDSGRIVRDGTYRATVEWRNSRGRRSSATTKVTVDR